MSTATKAAAATGSVAGGGLAGAAMAGAFSSDSPKQLETSIIKPQDKQTPKEVPPTNPIGTPTVTEIVWSALSLEMTSPDTTYNGKIGSEYKHLLTGPYGPTGNSTENWWNKQFEKYNGDKKSSSNNFSAEFAKEKVTSAFAAKGATSNDPDKALNRICDSVYKQATETITPTTPKNVQDNKSKLKDDLWKYCSNLETSPKTVEDAPTDGENYESTAYGKTKQSELLSVKGEINKTLWDLKQKEFFALTSVDDEFFKALHSTKNSNPSESALKNKCKEAYKQTTAKAGTSPSEENTVKYCSAKAIKT